MQKYFFRATTFIERILNRGGRRDYWLIYKIKIADGNQQNLQNCKVGCEIWYELYKIGYLRR